MIKRISKPLILVLVILLSLGNKSLSLPKSNIQDKILSEEFLELHKDLIYGHAFYSKESIFINNIKQLSQENKQIIYQQIKRLDPFLPSKILRAYIYWSSIQYNKDNIKKVLTYYMLYKALALRDFIENPLTSKKEVDQAKLLLKTSYKSNQVTTYNLTRTLLPQFNLLSMTISEILDPTNQVEEILSTDAITINFSNSIKNIPKQIKNDLGYVTGNKITPLDHDDISPSHIIKLIKSAKKTLIADSQFLIHKNDYSVAEFLIKHIQKKPQFKSIIIFNQDQLGAAPETSLAIILYLKKQIQKDAIIRNGLKIVNLNHLRGPASFLPAKNTSEIFRSGLSLSTSSPKKKNNHSTQMILDGNALNSSMIYHFPNKLSQKIQGPIVALSQHKILKRIKRENSANITGKAFFENFNLKKKTKYTSKGQDIFKIINPELPKIKNTVINMIKSATSNIYLDHFFIHTPEIVDSLIQRKIEIPNLRILILTDNNSSLLLNGAPNSFFLKELVQKGVIIRARRKSIHTGKNITSIDGRTLLFSSESLISLSQNHSLQIFSVPFISKYDQSFINLFYDNSKTIELDIENFQLVIGDKALNREDSAIFNGLGSFILRNSEEF